MSLTPDAVQDLVTIAFCLEPLADKPGCTTRFADMPGKPLEDFLIAGINAGKYFRRFAEAVLQSNHVQIFTQFPNALRGSNIFKSPKTVNFGLLEIMFPTVYARLLEPSHKKVIDVLLLSMERKNRPDVFALLEARKIAWQTSTDPQKRNFDPAPFSDCTSPAMFYQKLFHRYPTNDSNYQWADQFKQGLPIMRNAFRALQDGSGGTTKILGTAFRQSLEKNPLLKPGIIADMCAAALFLHLSFLRQ